MIFYFTGTGNSLQVARELSGKQNERLVSIAALMNQKLEQFEFALGQNEIIGFVFPIYSWNPPERVLQFIRKLKFTNYNGNYVFSVATCGNTIGNTMKTLKAELGRIGLPLHSGFSIQMPNNYIIGFDVDPKEEEKRKLLATEETLRNINKVIANREKGIFEIKKGTIPFIYTSIINPLFNNFAIRPEKFYATEQCTGCGICEKVCNCQNIKLTASDQKKGQRPVWGKECTQCFACINYCPARAIQYGKGTGTKGRYTNPNVSVNELSY